MNKNIDISDILTKEEYNNLCELLNKISKSTISNNLIEFCNINGCTIHFQNIKPNITEEDKIKMAYDYQQEELMKHVYVRSIDAYLAGFN